MTEELQVQPDDIDRFANSMVDLATQCDTAKKYVSNYFTINAEQARIYAYVKGVVDAMRENLTSNYEHLLKLSDGSALEMTRTAQMYRTTDIEIAKQLDATYSDGYR
ncbi:type VII secretion target [Nocardia wallacei]|uniref:type VII secretion target n=1 Tax=Nocardia wallacei TaxID=480035 RepID=UPI002453F89A|nr:type VII secretion target [Nocardia wallacei]